MMRNYALSHGRYGYGLILEEVPWWSEPLLTVTNKACELTRNRTCHRLCNPALWLVDRHTRRVYERPVTREAAAKIDPAFVEDMERIWSDDEGEETPE